MRPSSVLDALRAILPPLAGSRTMAMIRMKKHVIPMIVLILMLNGCGAPTSVTAQTGPTSPVETVFTDTPSLAIPAAPSPISVATRSPTQAPEAVIVTAAKGNIFIRRGPDLAYNAVSVLMDGQSGKAVARDVLGGWLQIFIPDNPKETGWISIQSRYSEVKGDVM